MPVRRPMVIPLLFALAIVLAPHAPAESQSPAARIGLLGPGDGPRFSEVASGLKQGLQEQGYREDAIQVVEGRAECLETPRNSGGVEEIVGRGRAAKLDGRRRGIAGKRDAGDARSRGTAGGKGFERIEQRQ